jgi:hypothetical protein
MNTGYPRTHLPPPLLFYVHLCPPPFHASTFLLQYRYCVDCGWEKQGLAEKFRGETIWNNLLECVTGIVRRYQQLRQVTREETLVYIATDFRPVVSRFRGAQPLRETAAAIVQNPLVVTSNFGLMNETVLGPGRGGGGFVDSKSFRRFDLRPNSIFNSVLVDYLMAGEGDLYFTTGTSWGAAASRTLGSTLLEGRAAGRVTFAVFIQGIVGEMAAEEGVRAFFSFLPSLGPTEFSSHVQRR